MDVIQFESLDAIGVEDARKMLAAADVVIGVDATTEREFTIFGRPSLESTTSLKRPTAMRTVRVILDCRSGELEKLLALVRAAKGSGDFEGTDE